MRCFQLVQGGDDPVPTAESASISPDISARQPSRCRCARAREGSRGGRQRTEPDRRGCRRVPSTASAPIASSPSVPGAILPGPDRRSARRAGRAAVPAISASTLRRLRRGRAPRRSRHLPQQQPRRLVIARATGRGEERDHRGADRESLEVPELLDRLQRIEAAARATGTAAPASGPRDGILEQRLARPRTSRSPAAASAARARRRTSSSRGSSSARSAARRSGAAAWRALSRAYRTSSRDRDVSLARERLATDESSTGLRGSARCRGDADGCFRRSPRRRRRRRRHATTTQAMRRAPT